MVVVAITGVLSAMTVAQYQAFARRARQSEAKIFLAAIYSVEQAYFAEHGTFSACLRQMGFRLGSNDGRYYTVGFDTDAISTNGCGPIGGQDCKGYSWNADGTASVLCANSDTAYVATLGKEAALDPTYCPITTMGNLSQGNPVSTSTFEGVASGCIGGSRRDRWTIDQTKRLRNTSSGV